MNSKDHVDARGQEQGQPQEGPDTHACCFYERENKVMAKQLAGLQQINTEFRDTCKILTAERDETKTQLVEHEERLSGVAKTIKSLEDKLSIVIDQRDEYDTHLSEATEEGEKLQRKLDAVTEQCYDLGNDLDTIREERDDYKGKCESLAKNCVALQRGLDIVCKERTALNETCCKKMETLLAVQTSLVNYDKDGTLEECDILARLDYLKQLETKLKGDLERWSADCRDQKGHRDRVERDWANTAKELDANKEQYRILAKERDGLVRSFDAERKSYAESIKWMENARGTERRRSAKEKEVLEQACISVKKELTATIEQRDQYNQERHRFLEGKEGLRQELVIAEKKVVALEKDCAYLKEERTWTEQAWDLVKKKCEEEASALQHTLTATEKERDGWMNDCRVNKGMYQSIKEPFDRICEQRNCLYRQVELWKKLQATVAGLDVAYRTVCKENAIPSDSKRCVALLDKDGETCTYCAALLPRPLAKDEKTPSEPASTHADMPSLEESDDDSHDQYELKAEDGVEDECQGPEFEYESEEVSKQLRILHALEAEFKAKRLADWKKIHPDLKTGIDGPETDPNTREAMKRFLDPADPFYARIMKNSEDMYALDALYAKSSPKFYARIMKNSEDMYALDALYAKSSPKPSPKEVAVIVEPPKDPAKMKMYHQVCGYCCKTYESPIAGVMCDECKSLLWFRCPRCSHVEHELHDRCPKCGKKWRGTTNKTSEPLSAHMIDKTKETATEPPKTRKQCCRICGDEFGDEDVLSGHVCQDCNLLPWRCCGICLYGTKKEHLNCPKCGKTLTPCWISNKGEDRIINSDKGKTDTLTAPLPIPVTVPILCEEKIIATADPGKEEDTPVASAATSVTVTTTATDTGDTSWDAGVFYVEAPSVLVAGIKRTEHPERPEVPSVEDMIKMMDVDPDYPGIRIKGVDDELPFGVKWPTDVFDVPGLKALVDNTEALQIPLRKKTQTLHTPIIEGLRLYHYYFWTLGRVELSTVREALRDSVTEEQCAYLANHSEALYRIYVGHMIDVFPLNPHDYNPWESHALVVKNLE